MLPEPITNTNMSFECEHVCDNQHVCEQNMSDGAEGPHSSVTKRRHGALKATASHACVREHVRVFKHVRVRKVCS